MERFEEGVRIEAVWDWVPGVVGGVESGLCRLSECFREVGEGGEEVLAEVLERELG